MADAERAKDFILKAMGRVRLARYMAQINFDALNEYYHQCCDCSSSATTTPSPLISTTADDSET